MTTTKLAPWGGSQAADANYAGKVAAGSSKAAGIYTRLHPGGFSRAFAVDSYAGKVPPAPGGKASGPFTRLHMSGFSRAFDIDDYGAKTPAVPGVTSGTYIPTFRGRRGRR